MWLKLDLEGIDFRFRISRYRKSTKEKWDDEWCLVDLRLYAQDWLNYKIKSDETLLSFEVERIRDKINYLLNDKIEAPEIIECMEPDFEFHLHPKEDIRNNPNISYVRPGYEIVDIDMDFVVNFWYDKGTLSSNRMFLCFGRDDLNKLLCYLNYITGAADENDKTVNELITEGFIYSDNNYQMENSQKGL